LVARERHVDDGRARSVTLTRAGRQVQATLWKGSASLRVEMESLFTSDALDSLVDGLDRIFLALCLPADQHDVIPRRPSRPALVGRRKARQP
jgi:hypothetical protein